MTDRFGLLYDCDFGPDVARCGNGVDFVEVIADRVMFDDRYADASDVLRTTDTTLHSLNLSLGSAEPLDKTYLAHLSRLAAEFRPLWASDHLAFTHIGGTSLGQLTPIPWDTAMVDRIAGKIGAVQDALGVPFLVENIAFYFRMPGSELTEAEFLHRLVDRAGCGILLDVNNAVVNSLNHGFEPEEYLLGFPLDAVGELHVAGHHRAGQTWIDSHGEPVDDAVWALLASVSSRLRHVNVVLERDQNVPPLAVLLDELAVARRRVAEGRARRSASAGT